MSENHDDDKMQSFTPLTKDTMIGHYRIIEKIGAGGMGEVYLAKDTALKRQVALKFLPEHLCRDEGCKSRFKREAEATAALKHPNIITIHEVSDYQGIPFFAMEYSEGKTLREFIRDKELSVDEIIDLITQLCDGLREAHVAGIVHRDVKPSNIILDKKGRPKLLDFGLAAIQGKEKITKTGTILGTIGFISPEQVRGEKVDTRSDLFSLGVILYELITGELPFKGDYEAATLYAIMHDSPKPIRQLKPDTPEGIQTIIDKALEKNPDDRYQAANDFLTDLTKVKGVLDFDDIVVTPEIQRKKPINRYFLSGATLVVAVLLVHILKPWRIEFQSTQEAIAAPQRLAVLYLKNLGSPDDEFISYGITEDLIVDLTRIGTMGVAPMRSIMKFKDSDDDLAEIAKRLNVNLILDGSIRKTENKIFISAQLIDVRQGTNLWAERWEETTDNLPHVKESLAQGISKALDIDTVRIRTARVGMPETQNPVAYEYYLRGKYNYERRAEESDVDVALELYKKALEMEPALLAARTGMAEIWQYKGDYENAKRELHSILLEAREKELKAGEAHALRLLATIHQKQADQPDSGLQYGARALELYRELGNLDGEYNTHRIIIYLLQDQLKHDEAVVHMERMLEIVRQLNDLEKEADVMYCRGNLHFIKGEYGQAIPYYKNGVALEQKWPNTDLKARLITNIGRSYYNTGPIDSALKYAEKSIQILYILGDPGVEAGQLGILAEIYSSLCDFQKSMEISKKAAAIYEEIGDQRGYLFNRNAIGAMLANRGLYDSAIAIFQENLELSKKSNLRDMAGQANTYLGFAYFYSGDPERAKKYFYEELEAARKRDDAYLIAYHAACLGELYYSSQEIDSSRSYFEEALVNCEKSAYMDVWTWVSAYLAAIKIDDGLFHDGIKELRDLIDQAKTLGLIENLIMTQRLLGEALIMHGSDDINRQDGFNILRNALAQAEEKEIAHEIKRIQNILNKNAS